MLSSCLYLAAISSYAVPASAFTSFHPNCTLPHVSYNYLSAPDVRSTLDITWSSLATIIACTFTVLHLNVPEQRDEKDPGFVGDLKWWWKGFLPTVKWTTIATVAPEYYAMNAINDYIDARITRSFLQSLPKSQPLQGWSLIHAFYINMGGYAVRLQAKGTTETPHQIVDDRGSLVHLGGRSFCMISRHDMHDSDRLLTDADITDRSKSDALAKCLALVQVLYFCISCIVRATKQLPISPMEIGTVGFALCSFISYGCLFKKPRSIKTAVVMSASVFDLDPHIRRAVEDERAERLPNERTRATVPNESVEIKLARRILPSIALAFGAVHFAAWNFAFPSLVEQWLWRVCVVYSTACLPIGYYLGLVPGLSRFVDYHSVLWVSYGMYAMSRLVMIGIMARCLFYLPPGSFMNTWAANLPHV